MIFEQISRSAMRLEEWLTRVNKTPTDLANEIDVDVSTITRLIPEEGKKQVRKPGWDLIAKIRHATGGQVTANDFMDEDVPREQTDAQAPPAEEAA